MTNYTIGCDAHKRFSQFAVLNDKGQMHQQMRVDHHPDGLYIYLSQFPEGTPVALECVGNWYWIVDEIERAGCVPLMAHAGKAKVMMGNINKTDKLDARGLATLLHNGTLPTVWMPPGEIRDERELPRTRMVFTQMRTRLKNRMHATLSKYNLCLNTSSDIFAAKWREELNDAIQAFPPETQRCMRQELELLDHLGDHIRQLEKRIRACIQVTESMQLLITEPGVGDILAIVIEREMGSPDRFPNGTHFASYSGTVPSVHASGGKTRYGRMPKQCNHYLKWAFIEAANVTARYRNHPRWRDKHVTRLYERICRRKGHAKAVGAVARHLSEAAFWMLAKNEAYKPPLSKKVLPKPG